MKYKNIMFIIALFIIICSTICLNHVMDPYQVLHGQTFWSFDSSDLSMVNTYMKAYKNKKSPNIIIGGSETCSLSNYIIYNNFFNLLNIQALTFKDCYIFLYNYLKLHPETKHVYISLPYVNMLNGWGGINKDIPKIKNDKYELKELLNLYLSLDTTIHSIKLLINEKKINQSKTHIAKKRIVENSVNIDDYNNNLFPKYDLKYIPYPYSNFSHDSEIMTNKEKYIIEYIDKIINLLNEKDIKYTFFSVPYNESSLIIIYNNELDRKLIRNVYKHIVKYGKCEIYDMAFINKYTRNNLYKDNYSLYYDFVHPHKILGIKIFKVLFDIKNAEKESYIILNKENIENELDKKEKIIEKYIKDNKNNADMYLHDADKYNNKITELRKDYKIFDIKNLPVEFHNDIEYIKNEIIYNK